MEQRQDKIQALVEAVVDRQLSRVQALLGEGGDPNGVDKYGRAPLVVATEFGHDEIVALLLQNGASPNPPKKRMELPLGIVADRGKVELVKDFLEAGADPNRQDRRGQTPLHYIQIGGLQEQQLTAARLLLEAGANPNVPNGQGKTPYELVERTRKWLVRENRRPEVQATLATLAEWMRQHGAHADGLERELTNAEKRAKLFGSSRIPQLLLKLVAVEQELQAEGLSLTALDIELINEPIDQGVRPPECIPFAHVCATGKYFALCTAPLKTADLSKAVVVLYGEQVYGSCARVIAESLKEFLALLITVRTANCLTDFGEDDLVSLEEIEEDLRSDIAPWTKIEAVSHLLQQRFRLKKIADPLAHVTQCRKRYPEMEFWNPDNTEGDVGEGGDKK